MKYNSENFNSLYNNFRKMFEEEGDVYDSILKSIEEDYQHNMIPDKIQKKIILKILNAATADHFVDTVGILTEEDVINKILKNENS